MRFSVLAFNKNIMIKTGIIGGAGYTAGELLRLLINHPMVEITFIHSSSNAGNKISDVHSGLFGETELTFTDGMPFECIDLLYLCMGHGDSKKFMETHGENLPKSLKIIDLANDFRLKTDGNNFLYGLPELDRKNIKSAKYVANPGCFATCIQLALLPLAKNGLLKGEVHVNAITGSTGAGQKPTDSTHFSWRNSNISIYKPFQHQHLPEIKQSLAQLQNDYDGVINFIPVRGDFARGIFATTYLDCELDVNVVKAMFEEFYADHPFTFVANKTIDLKQVVNTNKGIVQVEKFGNKLLITSIIDNLLKGASGQAVQNMNLMFGLDERLGLNLKSSAF